MSKPETPPLVPEGWRERADIVIIGGGLAGLFCALKLAPRPVTVISSAPIGEGASSSWAQGGIAAAMGEGDSIEAHLEDTLIAGAGIVDEKVARSMLSEASDRVHDLLALGVPFDTDLEGHLALSREAAHSQNRIVRVRGDMAGKAIMEALITAVRKTPCIRLLENYVAEDLVRDGRYVAGVIVRATDGSDGEEIVPSRAVIIATGGVGHLYAVTTNPVEANGDGIAMAARAGALLADAEFVQFHPTAINIGRDPAPLATEALRGEGATLINGAGERFMLKLHPDGELAPRDIVARGVFAEVQAGRGAFLDTRQAVGEEIREKFSQVYNACMKAGIDPVKEPIPIAPAAHYHMGGIYVDANGRSTIDGLWACGEAASTGAHGANRLASNSLLEAVVYAARVAQDISGLLPTPRPVIWPKLNPAKPRELPASETILKLRQLMSREMGVLRSGKGLALALNSLLQLAEEAKDRRTLNMVETALMMTASAYLRCESRGGHYRTDFPDANDALKARSSITLKSAYELARKLERQSV